jgi:hypothetical protein
MERKGGKGKDSNLEETYNLTEFIEVKGWKAIGNKIVGKDFISAFLVQNEEVEAETIEEKPLIKGNETTQQTLLVNEDLLQEERDKIKRLLSDDDSLLNQPKPKFKPKVPPKDDDQPKLF